MGNATEVQKRARGSTERMERVTLRLPKSQLQGIEDHAEESDEFENRSEAIRGALTELIDSREDSNDSDRR